MAIFNSAMALICALACATSAPGEIRARLPAPGAAIVVVEPDVRMSMLRSTGQTVFREDWSMKARAHVSLHARNAVLSRQRMAVDLPRAGLSSQARQMLLLHDAVRVSMRVADTGDPAPPTLARGRTWTLGPGAQALGAGTAATHALIVWADGDVTSSARAVFVVGAAAAGLLAPTGLQRASASLVDLETGDIVWRNAVVARPEQDMRDRDGANRLVTALLEGAPL